MFKFSLKKNTMDEISLCRLCQNEKGVYCFKKDKHILNWVEKYIEIKVSDDPIVFPNLLCISCKIKIFKFHSYVLYCREVNEQLQNTVEIVKLDTELSLSLYEKNDNSNCDPLLNDVQNEVTDDEIYEEIIYLDDSDIEDNIKSQGYSENRSIKDRLEEPLLVENGNIKNGNSNDPTTEYSQDSHIVATNKEYPCKLCQQKFTLKYKLKTHMRTSHAKEKCKQLNSVKNSTKKHLIRDKEEIDIFLCSFCGKGYSSKAPLEIHENRHKDVKRYPCKMCNKSFYTNASLLTHKRFDHLNEKFICSKCCRTFRSRSACKRHEIVHTGLKNFICKICDKPFFTNRELLVHNKIHTGLRPYKCSVCYKSFSHKHYLVVHERIHYEQKPFPCLKPTCKKQFVTQYKLNLHMKTHNRKELKLLKKKI